MRRPSYAPLLLVVLISHLLAFSGLARGAAGESQEVKRAREYYKAGEKAFNAGDFKEALESFEAGYALVPRPGFLLNMAHCERRQGQALKARALYKRYLLADPESKQRDEVLGFIAQLDAAIADEEKAGSADAEAPLAERPAVAPPPAPAPPAAPSPVPISPPPPALTSPPAAPPPALAISEPSAPAPALRIAAAGAATSAEPAADAPIYKRWWFWTAVGVVAAGAVVGVILATRSSPVFHDDGSLGRLGQP